MIYIGLLFLMISSVIIFISALGVFRFPDLFTRMHASSKSTSFGMALALIGIMFLFSDFFIIAEAIGVIIFIYITTPVASHMIARAAFLKGVKLSDKTVQNDLEGRYDIKRRYLESWTPDKADAPLDNRNKKAH